MELKGNTLDDLSSVIGFTATVRIAAWYGDTASLCIPLQVDETHIVAKLIGLRSAQKLAAEWGGQTIAVPRLANYERDMNKRLIMRMLQKGFHPREIARSIRLSQVRVMQIARELEVAGLLEPVLPKPPGSED